jgi:ribose transport system substrate-binding protein
MKKAIVGIMMLLIVVSFAVAQERKEITIANIRWDMGDIAFNGDQYGTETYLKEFEQKTGIKVKMLTFGSNDPIEQRKAAEAYFSRGIDGMLLSAINPPAVVPIVQEANRRNIPVVTHDSMGPGGKQISVFPLAVSAGEEVGKAILDKIVALKGDAYLKEKGGHIVELRGMVTLGVDIQRYQGWRNVLKPFLAKYPKVTVATHVAGFNAAKAREIVDASISRYGNTILGVFSIDGTMGVGGAIPALKSAGLFFPKDDPRRIPVGTIDGTAEEFEAVRRGDLDFMIDNGKLTQGSLAAQALLKWILEGWEAMPKPGQPLFPEVKSSRQPFTVIDGQLQDPPFEGYVYSFENLLVPVEIPANSEEGWGNAYTYALTGKWPWK